MTAGNDTNQQSNSETNTPEAMNQGGTEAAIPAEKVLGREPLRAPLPRRFYKIASAEAAPSGHRILLDGRPVRTPAKRELAVPTAALAEAIAAEWMAQAEHIDPSTMPLTRLANVAIDAVSEKQAEVADDIRAFAGSDLICYRAASPAGLVHRQHASWDPVLAWAGNDLGARLLSVEGIVPIGQSEDALAAIAAAVAPLDPFRLACLHVMTTLTGSAILALAHLRGRLTLDQCWQAAHVDERWQVEHWGPDTEAAAREAYRLAEFTAASRLASLLDPEP